MVGDGANEFRISVLPVPTYRHYTATCAALLPLWSHTTTTTQYPVLCYCDCSESCQIERIVPWSIHVGHDEEGPDIRRLRRQEPEGEVVLILGGIGCTASLGFNILHVGGQSLYSHCGVNMRSAIWAREHVYQ